MVPRVTTIGTINDIWSVSTMQRAVAERTCDVVNRKLIIIQVWCTLLTCTVHKIQLLSHTSGKEVVVMDGIELPCLGESADMLQPMSDAMAAPQHHEHSKKPEDRSSETDVTVYGFVGVDTWSPNTATATILQDPVNNVTAKNDSVSLPRKRKIKRPYSPEIHIRNKRLFENRRGIRKQKRLHPAAEEVSNVPDVGPKGKPFSCEKCHSPFIVNPARRHKPDSKRKYRPRKVTDLVTKQVLLVCNACGLSMVRSKKERHKKEPPTQEEKDCYLKKAAEFAASLAASLEDPDACRLYCPSFKSSACQCLQKYITENGKNQEGSRDRALHLLSLLKEAEHLTKQKNAQHTNELQSNTELGAQSESEKHGQQKPQVPHGLHGRRSKDFEEFVLKTRQYLREELHFCEKASQRVLMYSNNFLHKKLKTSPGRDSRVERVTGKNARGLLKPVSELVNETCCNDRCVTMVLTHSKLLETWRATAKLGQREARRVLAEMLTPSGGTKANCYKFISMVTGCSYSTICLVSDQMKRTQGQREPPEHGLKRWWRDHPRDKKQKQIGCKSNKVDNTDGNAPAPLSDISSIQLPDAGEMDSLSPQEASSHLQKLLEIQKQLASKQLQLQQQMREVRLKMRQVQQVPVTSVPVLTVQSAKNIETVTVLTPPDANYNSGEMVTRTGTQQVLHILELPASSSPSVITDNIHPQPTISVMTSTGEFEPLTNISVNLQGRGQTTFSNIVILPESALAADTATQGTSVISCSSSTEVMDSVVPPMSSEDVQNAGTIESVTFANKTSLPAGSTYQICGVIDTTTPNLLQFNY